MTSAKRTEPRPTRPGDSAETDATVLAQLADLKRMTVSELKSKWEALFATAAGTLAAYGVVTQVMDLPFTFSAPAVAGAVLGALALTVGFGLIGTLRALSAPPVAVLRHL